MNPVRTLGFNSLIYSATQLLQRGAMFLLLPLYTRYLAPEEYGILAVITAINGFLSILFTFSLHGAIVRYYFEYRDDPARLREFWGTVLTFVACSSVAGCALLLLVGEFLLAPVLGDIAFWPYAALGIVAVVFQPFVTTFLNVLQTRGEAMRYARYSLANFLFTLMLTVALIVFAGWGAEGPLTATLAASILFCGVALYQLRNEFRVCLNLGDLRAALAYCLPQIPHSLGAQVVAATDRLLLNRIAGAAAVGLYNVGSIFGMAVDIVGYSVNRAYVPIAMDILKRGVAEQLSALRDLGLLIMCAFILLGSTIALWSRELIALMAAPEFHQGYVVVPLIALGGAAGGVYYVLVNILFFDVRATRFLPLGMLTSALTSVAANLLLIPRFGILGAGIANLCAQITTAVVIAVIGRRYETIRWPYLRIVLVYAACCVSVIPLAYHEFASAWHSWLLRPGLLALLALLLGAAFWHDGLRLFRTSTYGFGRDRLLRGPAN